MSNIRYLIIVFLLFFLGEINAQIIVVVNSTKHEPIPGVVVSDTAKTKYRITNAKGEVNIDAFSTFDYILLSHNYYHSKIVLRDSIKLLGNRVTISKKTFNLEGHTVFANKWEQNKDEIPFIISEVKAKDIKFENPQTTPDMLANTGKVYVQKSQAGGGSPMIRGFAANSVLIVVDGVRMNNAIFRGGNLQNSLNIDPNSLGHTEIIFGPGSVTYGSDALGGVMDFHTKEVAFSNSKAFDIEADGFARVNSANLEISLGLGVDLKWKKFSSHTQFLRSDFGNKVAGTKHFGDYPNFGVQQHIAAVDSNGNDYMAKTGGNSANLIPTYYNLFNINQKFRYQPNKNFDITYSFIYSNTSSINRYDRLTQYVNDTLKYAKWYYGPQKWIMHNVRIRLFKPTKIYDSGNIIIAYQAFEESRNDRKFGSKLLRHRAENVGLYTFNMDFSKKLSENANLYYGVDASVNNVVSIAHSTNIKTNIEEKVQTRYPNKSNLYSTGGLFMNYKYKYGRRLTVLAGLRYSFVNLESKFDTTYNGLPFSNISLMNHAPNGSIGVAYLLQKDLQINANLATGFRAPNIDDVAKVFDSEPGHVVVPNSSLKPEYVYSAEFSIIKSFGKIVDLELTAYASYVDNIIVRRDFSYKGNDSILYDGSMSRVQAMQNEANAIIFGSVASLNVNLDKNIKFISIYNIAKGTSSDGENLRHIPPSFGTSKITYQYKWFYGSFYSNYSGSIAYKDLAPSERKKINMYSPAGAESWYTLNTRFEVSVCKCIKINISIENILDRFYMPYSSGIPASGRNFMIGIRFVSK